MDGIAHGFVTDIPNILPGGNESIDFPVSFDTKRNAIASSTACCLFNATCKISLYIYVIRWYVVYVVSIILYQYKQWARTMLVLCD